MNATAIDTLVIFDRLKKLFTEEQAHVISEIIKDVREENLQASVTKSDLKAMKEDLEHKINEMELRLKYELTLRFGVMLATAVAVLAAIIKLS